MATSGRRHKSRHDNEENLFVSGKFEDLPLSRINGEINKMTKSALINQLTQNGLNTKGVKEVLNRRLKIFYKKQRTDAEKDCNAKQYYKYFVVVDFEATCEETNEKDYIQEIIEFPAILLDAENGKEIDRFHSYCKPVVHAELSEFCSSFTGISQADVDAAPDFTTVYKSFEAWMQDRNLLSHRCCAFISDGPWDFSRFLNVQCCLSGIHYPKWLRKWINLKKVYGNFYKINRPKLEEMLSNLGLKFEGRPHSGIDDARNICKVIARLIEDGCVLQANERLNAGRLEPISERERESFKPIVKCDSVAENRNNGSDKENTTLEKNAKRTVGEDDMEKLGQQLTTCQTSDNF